ncbi:MAG: GtrA family protein [Paracoccaceae bacterium]
MRPIPIASAETLRAELATFLRFASVGAVATLVHLSVSAAALGLAGASAQIANGAGFAVAFAVSYLGHYHVTFRSRRAHRVGLSRFALVALSGYAVSVLALGALAGVEALPEALRLGLAIATIPAVNYVAGRLWVY